MGASLTDKHLKMFATIITLFYSQSLPSEDDYNKLRQARAAEIQRRIAAERRAAMEAQDRERAERERQSRDVGSGQPLSPHEEGVKMGHRRIGSGGDVTKKKFLAGIVGSKASGKGHTRNDSDGSGNSYGGWKPSEDHQRLSRSNNSDPMLQQMEIIRGYIRQAKEAQRMDEVTMLEQNLRDLADEYRRQQQTASN